MNFFENFYVEILITGILFIFMLLLRYILAKVLNRYAKRIEILDHRKNMIIKYNNIILTLLFLIEIFVVWGVETKDVFITISSIATVLGIAFFAQWSILSNITSGIIILLSFPFKIGDTIKIHDKDFPIEAEVEYIKTFYIILKTKDGEIITYPNNLLLQKGISVISPKKEFSEFTD